MNYAEAIEEEGYFEKARRAWIKAGEEWRQFGKQLDRAFHRRQAAAGFADHGWRRKSPICARSWTACCPACAQKLRRRKASRAHAEDRDAARYARRKAHAGTSSEALRARAEDRRDRSRSGRANRAATSRRSRTRRCSWPATSSGRIRLLQFTINYKRDANYDYWQTRADFEQTHNALTARTTNVRSANRRSANADLADGQEALPGRLRQVAGGDRQVPIDPRRRRNDRRRHCRLHQALSHACSISSTRSSATISRCGT